MTLARRRFLAGFGSGLELLALGAAGCGPVNEDTKASGRAYPDQTATSGAYTPQTYPTPTPTPADSQLYQAARSSAGSRQPYLDQQVRQISVKGLQGVLYDHNGNMIDYNSSGNCPRTKCTTLMAVDTISTVTTAPAVQSLRGISGEQLFDNLINTCDATSNIYVLRQAFDMPENDFKSGLYDHELLHVQDEHQGFAIGSYAIPAVTDCNTPRSLVLDPYMKMYIKEVRAYANQLINADARHLGSEMRRSTSSMLDHYWKKAVAEATSYELRDLLAQLKADLRRQGVNL